MRVPHGLCRDPSPHTRPNPPHKKGVPPVSGQTLCLSWSSLLHRTFHSTPSTGDPGNVNRPEVSYTEPEGARQRRGDGQYPNYGKNTHKLVLSRVSTELRLRVSLIPRTDSGVSLNHKTTTPRPYPSQRKLFRHSILGIYLTSYIPETSTVRLYHSQNQSQTPGHT